MGTASSRASLRASAAAVLILAAGGAARAQLSVSSLSPARNALTAPRTAPITVTFDRPVDPATVAGNVWAFARWSGTVAGALTVSPDGLAVTLTPDRPFAAGEVVMVILSDALRAADGTAIQPGGHTFMFTVAAAPSAMEFRQVQMFSNRTTPSQQTRIYGAVMCDLDRDSWCDMTLINEVSADLRICLNRADGSGLFHPFLQPPTVNEYEASPNEPGDFDRDGFTDICTGNTDGGTVSIHLGNGNGTFRPRQVLAVGSQPHGIAVLDVEGDGDLDIVSANTASNNLAVLLNNGAGVFGPASFIEGGGDGEYGLTAADMNNDGMLDLVVGNRGSQTISILRNNGTGTFTPVSSRAAGGLAWMVAAGDVNGDGNLDVSSANSQSNNGSILLGNGNGTLQAAVTRPMLGHVVSTDLADFDGDGDLDWVMSSFGGQHWRLYENNGAGTFTFVRDFDAPSNPACSAAADIDNDLDIDLILLDEIADVVLVMRNTCAANWNGDAGLNSTDISAFLSAWLASINLGNLDADFNGDMAVNSSDISAFLTAWLDGLASGC